MPAADPAETDPRTWSLVGLLPPDGLPARHAPAAWGPGIELALPPGVELTLATPTGGWAGLGWLWFDVEVQSDRIAMVELRFHEHDDSAAALTAIFGVLPDLRTRLGVPWSLLDGNRIYLERRAPRLKASCMGRRVDPQRLARVVLCLRQGGAVPVVRLSEMHCSAEEPAWPVPERVAIDELGQCASGDWPGRTRDADELAQRLRDEADAAPEPADPTRSAWGGDARRRCAATGWFRTQHDGQRWWLVDPEGHPFFSVGMDCAVPGAPGALLPGMERLCRALPPADAAGVWSTNQQGQRQVDLPVANLRRVFGDAWHAAWCRLTAGRLRRWGFNTIGNWSNRALARSAGLPWVLPMQGFPSTGVRLFRDLPDVFSDEYRSASETWAQQLAAVRDDRSLIGYFLSNEPHWAFGDFNLASEMLEDHPGSVSRQRLRDFLRERHGSEAAWRAAWNCPERSLDDVVAARWRQAARSSAAARADLRAFTMLLAERFVAVPSAATRAVDPWHLNLGLRFAWISGDACVAGAAHVDVFTVNCYRTEPSLDELARIAAAADRPVLIGEWHFGALDRGLPASGLRCVADQAARAAAYRHYVIQAARHPQVVGCHWFQLNDQPYLGRFDGENFQIGFVDVCQRPYDELVQAATAVHRDLYRIADGSLHPELPPVAHRPSVSF